MMKKSSLGRRSSIASQGRPSFADKNVSRMLQSDGRKSFIPKPCAGGSRSRASSVEREPSSGVRKEPPQSTLRRSKSYLSLDPGRTSTPCYTPVQYNARNTGSMYRNQVSEGGRTSSVGGLKSAKKESRPITERTFQTGAQQKIQDFFMSRSPDLLEKGSIKPMTIGMFADLVNFLIQPFEKIITINRNNPTDGVLALCKFYNYKGKAEKSWLRTVNTPHSWPHVVSFLVWLVELNLVSSNFNLFDAMYPEPDESDMEINDYDFKCLVPHLIRGYNVAHRQKPPGSDEEEMRQFLVEHKKQLNVDESEKENLLRKYAELQKELNNSEDEADIEKLEALEKEAQWLKDSIKKHKEEMYEIEEVIKNSKENNEKKKKKFADFDKLIEELEEKKEKLEAIVAVQQISPEEKQRMQSRIAQLQSEIKNLNEEENSYQDEVYRVDLKLVELRKAYIKEVNEYNKMVTLNLVAIPELKNLLIDDSFTMCMDAPDAAERFVQLDKDLVDLKAKLKLLENQVEVVGEELKSRNRKVNDKRRRFAVAARQIRILRNDYVQLETEMALLKKQHAKEQEQIKISLTEIQNKMKLEKEADMEKLSEDKELRAVEEKRNLKQKELDEFKEKASQSLKNRMKLLQDNKIKFEEIMKEKLEERRKIIEQFFAKIA